MGSIRDFLVILGRPTIGEATLEMVVLFLVALWIAFLVGVVIGWAWKPRWANLDCDGKLINCSSLPSPADLIPSPVKDFCSTQKLNIFAPRNPSVGSSPVEDVLQKEQSYAEDTISSSLQLKKEEGLAVTNEDFKHLHRLVDRTDGGAPWKHVMERSTAGMSYQAWQRDQVNGPPQYCSRTVYEDATPELLRDFFWDDEFRLQWDDMLLHSATLEECPTTGTMVVHWVRKFPFFCSDREYTIGRRIWESGRSYYCVTKGVPYPSVPRRDKPRRVDVYYSSWFIQAVASRKDGSLTACEVVLFHHEDMGIPYEITKFGVRQGMWGAVQKIERGLRLYQKARASGLPQSRSAFLAQINTKISPKQLELSGSTGESSSETQVQDLPQKPKDAPLNVQKLLVLGCGAVALACSLDRGLFTKAVVLGVARKFGNVGRKL